MTEVHDSTDDLASSSIFAMLARWFALPDQAPSIPAGGDDALRQFRPTRGYLRYMQLSQLIVIVMICIAATAGCIGVTVAEPVAGLVLAPVLLVVIGVPSVTIMLAVRLRYAMTWYVMTSRSLRIRKGIWVIEEITITFENVQNVAVHQGPLQRYLGFSNLVVETAGGGGVAQQGQIHSHQGLMAGIANAQEMRDLIMARVRAARSAGLGDDGDDVDEHTQRNVATSHAVASTYAASISPQHQAVLRDIRDLTAALASRSTLN